MRKQEQQSLIEALSYCSLRERPEPDDGDGYWIEALARVVRYDGSVAYVYVKRDENTLECVIKKVFGDVGGIALVDQYFPFEYLRCEFAPKFELKEDKVKYLSDITPGNGKLYAKMSNKALDEEILKIGMKMQNDFDSKLTYNG